MMSMLCTSCFFKQVFSAATSAKLAREKEALLDTESSRTDLKPLLNMVVIGHVDAGMAQPCSHMCMSCHVRLYDITPHICVLICTCACCACILTTLITCTCVFIGKSTLMGHLLYLQGRVSQKLMHKFEKESKEMGKASFAYAWVLDEQVRTEQRRSGEEMR